MWYYELNRKPFGPVSQEVIIEELKVGRVTRMTLVWREGWPQWKYLGETELAGKVPPPVVNATPPPVDNRIQKSKKVSSSSLTRLFWWWFPLFLFALPYQLLIIFAFKDFTSPNFTLYALAFLFWIPLCAGAVLHYILIYKLWQVVQDGFASTSPGRAVGFMFIPYFNYYWFLPAYYGLAKDLNAYIDRHFGSFNNGQLIIAHPKLVLSYVISTWSSVVLSYGLAIIMYLKMLISVLNGGSLGNSFPTFMLPAVVVSVLLLILQIVVFFDLFKSARSILKVEESQMN
ncbi:MAG: DUF4339 domain-containing protein [Proteobacteria bacterium]|nr:DUF4339 domain-containing protein [Pseudomonadota bacterium]